SYLNPPSKASGIAVAFFQNKFIFLFFCHRMSFPEQKKKRYSAEYHSLSESLPVIHRCFKIF
ncbi:MAG: hypothetical protein ACLUFH_17495, partial [Monoglobales bacterium]